MPIQSNDIYTVPLPWRKETNLHREMGARVLRYKWSTAETPPTPAAPLLIDFEYSGTTLDRIVGFSLASGSTTTAAIFLMEELNTGWVYSARYTANTSLRALDNIETLPDRVSLRISWSADPVGPLCLSFYNFEVVPWVTRL